MYAIRSYYGRAQYEAGRLRRAVEQANDDVRADARRDAIVQRLLESEMASRATVSYNFV